MRIARFFAAATTAALVFTVTGTADAWSQQQLPLGSVITTMTGGNDNPAVFAFNAETAGVLTVVVRGQGDADLLLDVTDSVGSSCRRATPTRTSAAIAGRNRLWSRFRWPATTESR
jgi:hypothetical protein